MKIKKFNIIVLILMLIMTACGPKENVPALPLDNLIPEPLPKVDNNEIPDETNLSEGNAYISDVQLFIMESYPIQVSVNIIGDLPTPCHSFISTIILPIENNEVHIDAYSKVDLDKVCIEVLDPFEENVSIPLNSLDDGTYSVFVNGEFVGEFSYPG